MKHIVQTIKQEISSIYMFEEFLQMYILHVTVTWIDTVSAQKPSACSPQSLALNEGSRWCDLCRHRLLLPACYLYKGNHTPCSLLCSAASLNIMFVRPIHPCSAFSNSSSFFFHCNQWNEITKIIYSTIDTFEVFLVFLGGALLQIILPLIFL